jgi:hypothetical protein
MLHISQLGFSIPSLVYFTDTFGRSSPSLSGTMRKARMMMNPPEAPRTSINEKSRLLHSYMSFRAEREEQPHDLSVSYYRTYIAQGIQKIFGVTVGSNGPVSDSQHPRRFAEWKAQQGKLRRRGSDDLG